MSQWHALSKAGTKRFHLAEPNLGRAERTVSNNNARARNEEIIVLFWDILPRLIKYLHLPEIPSRKYMYLFCRKIILLPLAKILKIV